jgi:Cu/Ag efflux protein CusF
MKIMLTCCLVTVLVATALPAGSQSRTIPGETKTTTATIESIDATNRTVTVKKDDGTYEALYVPESMTRFNELKVGNKVTATHYENIVVQVKRPGEANVDSSSAARVPAAQGTTLSRQRTITATIEAIDPAVPSITLVGPNGWKYSTRVQDRNVLSQVKVGDRLDITWTEATVVSIQ